MSKIGLKNIKIAKKGMVADSFFDQTGNYNANSVFRRFTEIPFVQETAVLDHKTADDENGLYHTITIDFTSRADFDNTKQLIESFIDKPVIILAEAVDGNNYVIGNNNVPAYISQQDGYNKLSTREINVSVEYKNTDGLQKVRLSSSSNSISVNQESVYVNAEGDNGEILVDCAVNWNVSVI